MKYLLALGFLGMAYGSGGTGGTNGYPSTATIVSNGGQMLGSFDMTGTYAMNAFDACSESCAAEDAPAFYLEAFSDSPGTHSICKCIDTTPSVCAGEALCEMIDPATTMTYVIGGDAPAGPCSDPNTSAADYINAQCCSDCE